VTVLPIVQRELRAAARQASTYWVRLGLALAAIFVGAVIFVLTFGLPPAQTGRNIFESLAGIMLLYCLSYGRRSTADCLSLEKREGTLGLLFLTDLKGLDVVLGKLVATSVRGFYALLAMFPVLAVPLLLGGITSGEFWRIVLVLMDTFLFSLAIGILGSAISRDLRRAMAANFLLLLLLMAIPPASMIALGYFLPSHQPILQLLFSCPLFSFYLCDETHYLAARDQFWSSVAVIHGLTWLLVLIASWIVPRSWQDRPALARKSRLRNLWHAWRHGPVAGKRAFRQRALDKNAFYWLAARERFKPVHVWTFLAFMAVWWLVGWRVSGVFWLEPAVAILTALLLNFTFKVWLAIEAGQQLAEERRTGAFELLLSAPLTVRDILHGQLLALRRQFLRPLLAVLGVEMLFLMAMHQRAMDWRNQVTWLAGMLMLVVDLVALSWVGMWRAMVAKNHNRATISTLLCVLVLPWALLGAVVTAANIWFGLVQGKDWSPSPMFYRELWLGLGLAVDVVFGLMAWWKLNDHFRELALRRFNPASSPFARWFGLGRSESTSPRDAGPATQAGRLDVPRKRDEHNQDNDSGTSALLASPRLTMPSRTPRRRLWLSSCLVPLIIGLGLFLSRSRSHLPPPVVVSINQSNGPVRVSSGPGAVLLILPDGSLWLRRRFNPGAAALSAARVLEQVGTNHDWVEAVGGYPHLVGLRRDGTLWEWGRQGGPPVGPADALVEPRQVGSSHDWVSVASTLSRSVALRRNGTLWTWGDATTPTWTSGLGSQSNSPVPAGTNLFAAHRSGVYSTPPGDSPVQVGTNSDWVAACCDWGWTLALRRDGTLWVWGQVPIVGVGWMNMTNLPSPMQMCVESNWDSFLTCGSLPLVRNRLGEVWEPFLAAPNPEASAASSFRLVATNAAPGRFATAWCGQPRTYEVRSDASLWERTQPLSTFATTPVGEWRRLGKRSDWTALWGTGGTALGLTGDGTIWTWGLDPGGNSPSGFLSRLKLARSRLMSLIGPGPRPMTVGATPAYQEQPRPLMRLEFSKTPPPASTPNAAEHKILPP